MKHVWAVVFAILVTATAGAQGLPPDVTQAYRDYEAALDAGDADALLEAAARAYEAGDEADIDRATLATLAENYGFAASANQEFETAQTAWRNAARLSDRARADPVDRAWRWHNAAMNAYLAGDTRDAWACAGEAIDIIDDQDTISADLRDFAGDAYFLRARLAASGGRALQAGQISRDFLELPRDEELAPQMDRALAHYYRGIERLIRSDMSEAAYNFHLSADIANGRDADSVLLNRISALSVYTRGKLFETDDDGETRETHEYAEYREMLDGDPVHSRWYATTDDAEEVVDPGLVPAEAIERANPPYPQSAAQAGYEGVVIVQFDVLEDGTVHDPNILESLPPGIFDEVVLETMGLWQYQPAMRDGQPVESSDEVVHFTFTFAN